MALMTQLLWMRPRSLVRHVSPHTPFPRQRQCHVDGHVEEVVSVPGGIAGGNKPDNGHSQKKKSSPCDRE
jgi:hypothetical protein